MQVTMEVIVNTIAEQDVSTGPITEQPAYSRLFAPGKLTVGLILPLETHPNSPAPTMRDHVSMAQKAENLGFAALWMRDVPFYDPRYGDMGQIFDPIPYIGFLAAFTQRIALGTAGIVLPMRCTGSGCLLE